MMKFAIAVTVVMVGLTAAAAIWIAVAEAPAAMEYLTAQNLVDIGLNPTNFRAQRLFLPGAVTWCTYRADLDGGATVLQANTRLGETRAPFDEAVARETANSKNPRPAECRYEVSLEKEGRDQEVDVFVAVRAYPYQNGHVSAEVWLQEATNHFHVQLSQTDVPPELVAKRRDWCRRQAINVARIMLGAVREEQDKKKK